MKTLYENGKILTMESLWPAEALIEEEGKIRFVGRRQEALSLLSSGDKRKDLCGHTLMPGFVDGHSHLTGCASALSMVQLGECEITGDHRTDRKLYPRAQHSGGKMGVCHRLRPYSVGGKTASHPGTSGFLFSKSGGNHPSVRSYGGGQQPGAQRNGDRAGHTPTRRAGRLAGIKREFPTGIWRKPPLLGFRR